MAYPAPLQELIVFFEGLSESERREALIDYAAAADSCARKTGVTYHYEEVRKDAICSDAVGVFLHHREDGKIHFAVELGPKVQTLTRALTTILCRGLDGCTLNELRAVPPDFVPRLIGAELVRLRSQTVYYVLDRLKEALARWPAEVSATDRS
jgi:cysteine desulfuration protein SufE